MANELGYTGMDSVFDDYNDDPMQSMFGDSEDGDLIDYVSGLNEDGSSVLDGDFDELHNEDDEAEPEDFEDTLGPDHDTPGAPEIKKSDAVDAALGEAGEDHTEDGSSDVDANAFEGRKVDPDVEDLEGESDDAIDAALGEGADCEDGGCDDNDDLEDEPVEENSLEDYDDEDLTHEPGDEELIDMVMGGQA